MRRTTSPLAAALWTLVAISLSAAFGAIPAFAAATRSHSRHIVHATCLLNGPRRAVARSAGRVRAHRACRQHVPAVRSGHSGRILPAAGAGTPALPRVTTSSPASAAAARSNTIAAVLAQPCANTELLPEAGNLDAIRAAVLCLINRERAQNGETPLRASGELQQAAEGHSQELVADDYFAHVSPSGMTPVDRIRATGYIPNSSDGYIIGENLAWGTFDLATPQVIVSAWIASPEHLANILEAQYTETGIGVVPAVPASLGEGSPGATYAQEFGVLIP